MTDIEDSAELLGDDDGEEYDLGQDEEAELLRDDDEDEACLSFQADPIEDEEQEESHRDKFASERQSKEEPVQIDNRRQRNDYNNSFRKRPLISRGGRRGRGSYNHYNNGSKPLHGNRMGSGQCYLNPTFLKKPVQMVQPCQMPANNQECFQPREERRLGPVNMNVPRFQEQRQVIHQPPGQYSMPMYDVSEPQPGPALNWQPLSQAPQPQYQQMQPLFNNYNPPVQTNNQCYHAQPVLMQNQPMQQPQQLPYMQQNNGYQNHNNYQNHNSQGHQPFSNTNNQYQQSHYPNQMHQTPPIQPFQRPPMQQSHQFPAPQPNHYSYSQNTHSPQLFPNNNNNNHHSQQQYPINSRGPAPKYNGPVQNQPQHHPPSFNYPQEPRQNVQRFTQQQSITSRTFASQQFRPRNNFGSGRYVTQRGTLQNQGYGHKRVHPWQNEDAYSDYPKRKPWTNSNNNTYVDYADGDEEDYAEQVDDPKEIEYFEEPQEELTQSKVESVVVEDINEDEDEETKAYRQKIEEQKRQREAILAQKEKNRKLALLKKSSDEPKQIVHRAANTCTVKGNPNLKVLNVASAKTEPVTNNIQLVSTHNDVPSGFLNRRRVITKDETLPNTSLVVVRNLAASTTEPQLRKLCHSVGLVQNFTMSSKERQAKIEFKSVASAHTFYKKYQRHMLDLSMIQVELVPKEIISK